MQRRLSLKEHALRLIRGMDLRKEIEIYVTKHAIKAGAIVSCAGCVSEINIRTADGVSEYHEQKDYEIVSLQGTVSMNGCHIHIALSDQSLRTIGGHLKYGCIVNTTAEIVLLELESFTFSREMDEATGYPELMISSQ